MPLRQPIVVVMGHVDHGKTSLLDAIRSTNIAKKEAGAITQHIGASEVPIQDIRQACSQIALPKNMQFSIPGLLFIDTPGHESFTHLRQRGGSIADIAILVVDITQGFQPQTDESIRILKEYRTPFVLAANKIDLISGWRAQAGTESCSILSSIASQRPEVQARLDELIYMIAAKLSEFGISSERFDRISDFTKQVAIIPISAKTGEGMPELLLTIAGLSQKFLEKDLRAQVGGPGKGTILEVKEEKGLGTTIDVILYDGTLRKNDGIIFGTLEGAAKAKVRGILKPKLKPTGEGDRYEYVDEVSAAAGVKIYAPGLESALAGSPLMVEDGSDKTDELGEISALVKGILAESEKNGVILKADTLGSLEALRKLLASNGIEVKKAGIGKVTKKDVVDASVVKASAPLCGVVLSFSVPAAPEAEEEAAKSGVKIFSSNVIYSLCEDYLAWVAEEKKKSLQKASEKLPSPAKILAVAGCIFRASKPAIFGVEVLLGRLKKGSRLMKPDGEIIGEIREMQKEGKGISEAKKGERLAISVEGAVCGKSFSEGDVLYSYITAKEGAELLEAAKDSMPEDERQALSEILAITDRKMI
ncbi:MAG: translation initiation factor IF-2 [Candidatus Micrarchaeota archaeon]|nr:translation initiation factor IF-2 [Candidatus Micrarchaeota archaeon]